MFKDHTASRNGNRKYSVPLDKSRIKKLETEDILEITVDLLINKAAHRWNKLFWNITSLFC